MYIVDRTVRFVRGFLLSFGPTSFKRALWDKEYSDEKWAFAYNTVGDPVYPYLEKYAAGGSILDIGCGSGNTANELKNEAYQSYVGVDISEAALAKAAQRSRENGRQHKTRFECSDFFSYVPTREYDVVLFRESMYHVPLSKIRPMLQKYSACLKRQGVVIVRLATRENGKLKYRPTKMIQTIEAAFEVVEKYDNEKTGVNVVVCRPRQTVERTEVLGEVAVG
ncbi:MAG TPA: class I SAM-dependent methyltransferase [Terriglobales bacterium]|nr:class I SAM-dependent methyltransferase [Terriglobales bacterium]